MPLHLEAGDETLKFAQKCRTIGKNSCAARKNLCALLKILRPASKILCKDDGETPPTT